MYFMAFAPLLARVFGELASAINIIGYFLMQGPLGVAGCIFNAPLSIITDMLF